MTMLSDAPTASPSANGTPTPAAKATTTKSPAKAPHREPAQTAPTIPAKATARKKPPVASTSTLPSPTADRPPYTGEVELDPTAALRQWWQVGITLTETLLSDTRALLRELDDPDSPLVGAIDAKRLERLVSSLESVTTDFANAVPRVGEQTIPNPLAWREVG